VLPEEGVMYERTIETSASPHVTVEACRGNLTVRGDAEREIALLVQGEEDEVVLEREGQSVSLTLPDQTMVICPPKTTLDIRRVLGNLRVEGVEGPITGAAIHGNVRVRAVGPVALEETLGNLRARDVVGGLQGEDVKGNAQVQNLDGELILERVAGNLMAEGIEGGLRADEVRGNVRLGPPYSAGATYRVNASGNLAVSVPTDASLRVALQAGGRVDARVPGLELEETDGDMVGSLRAGEATLEAKVQGNASLRSTEAADSYEIGPNLEGLSAEIEWQVNEAVARMATRLEESLGRIDTGGIRQRVDQATEQARQKAEQAAEQARRRAEQAAERARMRAEGAERRWRRVSGQPSQPSRAAATDEERLRVLRMVEEGQLTPEQASELLAALEGE
jgi:hypothetical protein